MELFGLGLDQNRTFTLGLKETLAPKEEASKVSLWVHVNALSASQRVGWLVVAANVGNHDPVRIL
jgi:hypothetical protein